MTWKLFNSKENEVSALFYTCSVDTRSLDWENRRYYLLSQLQIMPKQKMPASSAAEALALPMVSKPSHK